MNARVPGKHELEVARQALLRLENQGNQHVTSHSGTRVRWRRWGAGPDIVLIHGGHGSWMHWSRNVQALASNFTVWVPDMPGFGDSDALEGPAHDPNRFERLADALGNGLRQLPLSCDTPGIAGFSFGGIVAARLASTEGNIHRLALLGTAGHGGTRRQIADLLNWRQVQGDARWQAHAQNLNLLMLHDPMSMDAEALYLHALASGSTRFRSKAISRSAPLPQILSHYHGDLLLIWGEHDVTAVPAEIGQALLKGRHRCELRIVPNAGHWVQYEQSAVINNVLTDWFKYKT